MPLNAITKALDFLICLCSLSRFRGNELLAEEAVQLIHRTGGIAALAHPWALKNPSAVIKSLKASGLHAIEVYRSDGKLAGMWISDYSHVHLAYCC